MLAAFSRQVPTQGRARSGDNDLTGAVALATLLVASACAEPRAALPADEPSLAIVRTIPANLASEQSRRPGISLCFSTFLDPRAITTENFWLASGVLTYDVFVEHELVAYRDPQHATQLAQEAWCPGSVLRISPRGVLVPLTRYRLHMRAAGLHSWTGQPLLTQGAGWLDVPAADETSEPMPTFFVEFTTTAADPRPNERTPGDDFSTVTLDSLFAAGHVFDPQRRTCSCHQSTADIAATRLDLRSPQHAAALLDSTATPTGFPMVAPREPASSYLIQKLAHDSDGAALPYVRGDAMPSIHRVEHRAVAELSAWIAGGARLGLEVPASR